jgi:hypothetical protein
MRRIASFALVLLSLAGCSEEQRICRRMGELCGSRAAECKAFVEDLERTGGDETVARLARCYAEAKTCAGAKGCEARVTVESAASAVGDFFESLTQDEDER